jgi:hypothetical protein
MNKIGTGSEISRYAHGLYLGSPSTAIHYLNTYKDYKPADTLKHQGVEFDVKTDAGRMAAALINNRFNVDDAKAEVNGDIYHQVAHALTRDNEDGRANASTFFCQKMGVSMIEAEAMQGGPNQTEFIILSQKFADSCKIDVVDLSQSDELEYDPPNSQRESGAEAPGEQPRRSYY